MNETTASQSSDHLQHDHPSEPIGLIARLRSEAYRIAEYGLQRDHTMAADELERLCRKFSAGADADVRLSEENDALIEENKVLKQGITRRWRPIETAPKNGSSILVARHMGQPWGWVLGTAYWVSVRGISGWIARGITEPPGELGLGEPTHWQPLPPPPDDVN